MTISNPTSWKEAHADKGDKYDKIVEIITDVNASVKNTGNETIAGVKTFTSFPVTPSSLPSSDYEVANKVYVDGYGSVIRPYKAITTINSRPAMLLFLDNYDEYDSGWDGYKPLFWNYNANCDAAEDSNNYFYLEDLSSVMQIHFYSLTDSILSVFTPPQNIGKSIVVKLRDFTYNYLGTDRFDIVFYAIVWDDSAGMFISRMICQLRIQSDTAYHNNNGSLVDTGWGSMDSLGEIDLTFFLYPDASGYAPTSNRCPYRIECTGKTAVTGHRDDLWDDDNDRFVCWHYWQISTSLSAGWDGEAFLKGLEIYVRDNDDL